jgi:hypothetical protein
MQSQLRRPWNGQKQNKGDKQMGRPIKKKFFGDLAGKASWGTGVGAEGIASIAVTNTATNSGYSTTTQVTWVASAPQITGGVPASGTAVVWYAGGTGRIQSLKVVNSGTGYTSTSSVTLTYTPTSAGAAATLFLTTSTGRQDSINIISYLTTASQSRTGGDIIKQESSRRYLVQNSDGIGICRLSTGTLANGQMHIIGYDYGGASYWITKLSARKATVYPRSNTSTAYVSVGKATKWTLGVATGTMISLSHTV